jgi:hypothetical protein
MPASEPDWVFQALAEAVTDHEPLPSSRSDLFASDIAFHIAVPKSMVCSFRHRGQRYVRKSSPIIVYFSKKVISSPHVGHAVGDDGLGERLNFSHESHFIVTGYSYNRLFIFVSPASSRNLAAC